MAEHSEGDHSVPHVRGDPIVCAMKLWEAVRK